MSHLNLRESIAHAKSVTEELERVKKAANELLAASERLLKAFSIDHTGCDSCTATCDDEDEETCVFYQFEEAISNAKRAVNVEKCEAAPCK